MQWVIRQRSPAGDWFVRATLGSREEAEEFIVAGDMAQYKVVALIEDEDHHLVKTWDWVRAHA